MAIPGFQDFMLPVLQLLADGREHSYAEIRDTMAALYGLTEDDMNEMLPSGRQTKFANRISWTQFYLRRAGLAESTDHKSLFITDRGLEVLESKPSKINLRYLNRFPEFVEFR